MRNFVQNNKEHAIRDKKAKTRQWLMSRSIRFFLVCFISVFSILYLMQVNSAATKGYDIAELERKIAELEQDNDRFNFQIAKYRSMHSIQSRLQGLDMVLVKDIKYVDLTENVFVRK